MASFWDGLPRDGLSAAEKKLRQHLLAAADAARQFLPRTIPVQQWVERRIATELQFSKGPNGIDIEKVKPVQAKTEPKDADLRRSQLKDPWFDTLPNDSFLPAEEDCRQRILELLQAGPLLLPPTDARLQRAMQGLMPHRVPLERWVERRIGGEVQIQDRHGAASALVLKGQAAARDAPEPPRRDPQAEERFFDSLPEDSFLDSELETRDTLYQFFQRRGVEGASISQAFKYRAFKQATEGLLPQGVDISGWIARRMGAEVECIPCTSGEGRKDSSLRLLPAGLAELESRAPSKGDWKGDGKGKGKGKDDGKGKGKDIKGKGKDASGKGKDFPQRREEPDPLLSHEERAKQKQEKLDAFFSTLPDDKLTDLEESLRGMMLSHLAGGDWVILSSCTSNPETQEVKRQFLPQGISFLTWIDHRIGGEIETGRFGDNGSSAMVRLRGDGGQDAPMETAPHGKGNRKGFSKGEGKGDGKDDGKGEGKNNASEDFFSTLPDDEHLPGEQELRAAILDLIQGWNGPGSPTTNNAGSDQRIQAAKKAFGMPKNVSLAGWIDRRIGGEVSTIREKINGREEVVLCLRGAAAAGKGQKRPRDEAFTGKGGKKGQGKSKDTDKAEKHERSEAARAEKADQFFSSLTELLSPGEEELKESLLDIIANTTDTLAPTVHGMRDKPGYEAVNIALQKVLPGDRTVGLLAWMQRRISDDIEVMRIKPSNGPGKQFCYFGIPGTLDNAFLQQECDEITAAEREEREKDGPPGAKKRRRGKDAGKGER